MILTFKIRHNRDFSHELLLAKKVAEYAIVHRTFSSKDVKHFGLKSAISCQILRKYGRNKKIKRVSRVNLVVPGQGIKYDERKKSAHISSLKLDLDLSYIDKVFSKINQIEISKEFAFVSVTVDEAEAKSPLSWIGVDLNATGHCCVVGNPTTGKILKLGKSAKHTHIKYMKMRKHWQKLGKYKMAKKIKGRESNIVRNMNHNISKAIIGFAQSTDSGIVLEDLKNIRKTRKQAKSFRYLLHSWSFAQLKNFVEYKAKLLGIPVVEIDPKYTSQQCSRCGRLGRREGKKFSCPCGHVEHADANASFVIALRHQGMIQLPEDRDSVNGSTDAPQLATC